MSKPSNQILLRIPNPYGNEIIRRGKDGTGYFHEGYYGKVSMDVVPNFSVPINQEIVALEFEQLGKKWDLEE